MKSSVFAKD